MAAIALVVRFVRGLKAEAMASMTVSEAILPLAAAPLGVRIYAAAAPGPAAPLVLHLHGGAFICGSLDSGQAVSTLLAESGAIVISAGYPLAPRSAFPQTLQTVFLALAHLWKERGKWAGRKSPLFVAGEEAGGNLAAGLAMMVRDQRAPPLAGQILVSPMLDPSLATGSIRDAEAGPVGCRWANGWRQYLGTADKACHPYAAPFGSSRLGGVARALVLTADDDPMRDESIAYATRLRASGVSAEDYTLPAPTGWPCSLAQAGGLGEGCAAKLRERFKQFFAGAGSFLCPGKSVKSMRA